MPDTPEGIGALKWSFLKEDDGKLYLMQGKTRLAEILNPAIKMMLVAAPQLWTGANDLLVATDSIKDFEHQPEVVQRMGNALAKAVGKTNWREVVQSS